MLATERRAKIIKHYRERIADGSRIKLYSDEFETLINDCIQRIDKATSLMELEILCKEEIALLEEGYPLRTLAGDYIPRYRKAIEKAIANETIEPKPLFIHEYNHQQRVTGIIEQRSEHWALTYFKYDLTTYEEVDPRQDMAQQMELLKKKGVQPQPYLQQLEMLLNDKGKFKLRCWAVACCALTGRSFAELLDQGKFQVTDHPHLLRFEATPKKDGGTWELLTLLPAADVLKVINRLRRNDEVKPLIKAEGEERTKAINLFNAQLNRIVNQYFLEWVPTQAKRKAVSLKDLRDLWGSLALWQFAPEQQRELFVEQYLVPVMGIKVKEKGVVYDLINQEGAVIKQKGSLLGNMRGLPLEEVREEEDTGLDNDEPVVEAPAELEVAPQDDFSQLLGQQVEKMRTEFVEQILGLRAELMAHIGQQVAEVRLPADIQERLVALEEAQGTPRHGGENAAWLVGRVGELEQENQALEKEVAALKEQVGEGSELEAAKVKLEQDNERLTAQLSEAQAKLDRFRVLILGEANDEQPVTQDQGNGSSEVGPGTETVAEMAGQSVQPRPAISAGDAGRTSSRGKAAQRAHMVFDALRAWNQDHPDATIALNAALLEKGFGIHRAAAKTFLTDFAAEVGDHHAEIGVEVIHSHNRGKNLEGFKTFATQREGL